MTRITINPTKQTLFPNNKLRMAATDERAERMEARMAEMDMLHIKESQQLANFVNSIRKKFSNRST
jgi:hypothetical protein